MKKFKKHSKDLDLKALAKQSGWFDLKYLQGFCGVNLGWR